MITQNNIHEVSLKVNNGSGVLVKINQNFFVITAIHCLSEESNNIITNYNRSINYDIKNYFYHKNRIKGVDEKNEDDIVLVQIECPKDNLLVEVATNNIAINDTIRVYGFPNKGENDGTPMGGKISKWHDTKTVETDLPYIGSNTNFGKAIGNILGWSGSGLFKEIGKKLYLIGILKKLQDEEYTYQSINCISIETILEVIEFNKLGSFDSKKITNIDVSVVESDNLRYINQLRKSYNSDATSEIETVSDIDESKYDEHFKRARRSFRMVEDLRQLSRDNLPEGTYEEFQDDMYEGIINTVEDDYKNAFFRVKETEKESTKIIIESYPSLEEKKCKTIERKGVCHQLVNDEKINWIEDE
jgi:hypothetical protein